MYGLCLLVFAIGDNIFTFLCFCELGTLCLELKSVQELLDLMALELQCLVASRPGHTSSRGVIGIGCVPVVGYRQTGCGINCHNGSIVWGWNEASYLGWNNVCHYNCILWLQMAIRKFLIGKGVQYRD